MSDEIERPKSEGPTADIGMIVGAGRATVYRYLSMGQEKVP